MKDKNRPRTSSTSFHMCRVSIARIRRHEEGSGPRSWSLPQRFNRPVIHERKRHILAEIGRFRGDASVSRVFGAGGGVLRGAGRHMGSVAHALPAANDQSCYPEPPTMVIVARCGKEL